MTSAVVVGSGPNGLAAALTLAAAGVRVRIIEAADVLGGGVRSAELTLPGLVHDECSAFHPFALGSSFGRDFDLAGAGLTWLWAPAELAHPLSGSEGAVLLRSVAETAAGLGGDGDRWQRTFGPLAERFGTISGEFLQPMLHVPKHPLHLARFGAFSAPPATLLGRRFREDPARALFGGVAAHAFNRLDRPLSSAIGVALTTAAHAFGWPVAEGGSSAIRDAILRRCEEYDVTTETGRTVTAYDEITDADLVLLDTTPGAALQILGDRVPGRVRRGFRRFRHGPGAFKVDFAVAEGVPWSYEPARRAGTVHLGGRFEETVAAERSVARGVLPERPFVLVGQQWLADPSRSVGDTHPLYSYAHVPAGYDGPDDVVTEAIIARIEEHAPGFRDRILATHVRSAAGMAQHNANYVGGDITTGANDARQLVFRPRAGLSPYSTGVEGVYLCSAATPPGAGAHGMCGHLAARKALADLGR
ncbi:phytoene desaturase family protein [Nocardioides sp. CPCC 206347]|uniref:phytoene desaturase family protein n=2 Tax=Nocardioides TaxID=1839 RepID=UPI003B43BD8A